MNDIQAYLNNISKYQKNQQFIGLRKVFRGHIVKSWTRDLAKLVDYKHNSHVDSNKIVYYIQVIPKVYLGINNYFI